MWKHIFSLRQAGSVSFILYPFYFSSRHVHVSHSRPVTLTILPTFGSSWIRSGLFSCWIQLSWYGAHSLTFSADTETNTQHIGDTRSNHDLLYPYSFANRDCPSPYFPTGCSTTLSSWEAWWRCWSSVKSQVSVVCSWSSWSRHTTAWKIFSYTTNILNLHIPVCCCSSPTWSDPRWSQVSVHAKRQGFIWDVTGSALCKPSPWRYPSCRRDLGRGRVLGSTECCCVWACQCSFCLEEDDCARHWEPWLPKVMLWPLYLLFDGWVRTAGTHSHRGGWSSHSRERCSCWERGEAPEDLQVWQMEEHLQQWGDYAGRTVIQDQSYGFTSIRPSLFRRDCPVLRYQKDVAQTRNPRPLILKKGNCVRCGAQSIGSNERHVLTCGHWHHLAWDYSITVQCKTCVMRMWQLSDWKPNLSLESSFHTLPFTMCVGQPFKMLPGQMLLKITVKVLFWLVQLLQDCGTICLLLLLCWVTSHTVWNESVQVRWLQKLRSCLRPWQRLSGSADFSKSWPIPNSVLLSGQPDLETVDSW